MATKVKGKVTQIWVNDAEAEFRLSDLAADSTPKSGNFSIRKSDRNFNALYSLALSAAINRYNLSVETTKTITPDEIAVVKALWVFW